MRELDDKIKKCAEWMLGKGFSVIPISRESKKPAVKWSELVDTPLSSWNYPDCNIGLITGRELICVDCDSVDSYVGWLKHMPPTPLRIRSVRGMHFLYRAPDVEIKSDAHIEHEAGFKYDVKGRRSYCMLPPSMRKGFQYQVVICSGNIEGRWMSPESLPYFNPDWRPERERVDRNYDSEKRIGDVVAYINQIEAVAGQGGDKATYRVCCRLAESGLSQLEAYSALQQWNMSKASPPWEEWELRRKLSSAFEEVSNTAAV